MKIIAFDPSGSFKYGSGTSGWCIMEDTNFEIIKLGNIKAKDYETKELYFKAHIDLLEKEKLSVLVIENFILYKGTASSMVNKELETSELIGYIVGKATELNMKVYRQNSQEIKTVLKKSNIILNILNHSKEQIVFKKTKKDRQQWYYQEKRISNHIIDAIRHAVLYSNKIQRGMLKNDNKD